MVEVLVYIGLCIFFITEALHDNVIQDIQDPAEKHKIWLWHKYSFIQNVTVVGIISYLLTSNFLEWWLVVMGFGFLRMFILNTVLNLLRDKEAWYLGNVSKIDKLLKPMEKQVWVGLILLNSIFLGYLIFNF